MGTSSHSNAHGNYKKLRLQIQSLSMSDINVYIPIHILKLNREMVINLSLQST
jgi:hypothetical protein